ncbi:MAG: UPF0223 family protein [Liquorilactobacillus hordei]|uniref:Uncharacterized protein n=2 Tax=Liquorilactobacillus hordei TaxID=468911 RepID=A0A0R1MRK5_9LACO|nr:UPF0223 family protein [Liquorilactobacillus hordei]AUJ30032.1 hypothetical protein BSQ49_07360 [Liquorilactobacillus hordei]KRL07674.1 hypothetical protein FC92_GL001620 [Liquorilactobacillus hordei DSM 19519]MBZ2404702.1 hypothetical protein [Liquorilactobacillus hordei]QYH52638.1 UPF0223 family protein [Liquorilactobacillus hordei DSM 19519]
MQIPNNFEYPLLPEWSTNEIVAVTDFYQIVEKLYTAKVEREDFLKKYQAYQKAVPMKMNQKKIDRAFCDETGMSIYQATKFVLSNNKKFLHLDVVAR